MSLPRWSAALLRLLAPADRVDDVVGDMEEAHRARVARSGRVRATFGTALETLDMARALVRVGGRGSLVSWLDFKLGFRMLVKYPGLTVLGVLAMAFAVVIGAGTFEFVKQVTSPDLPFPGGDRVVAIRLWHMPSNTTEDQALWDVGVWRKELTSVEEIGAWRTIERNLIAADGTGALVTGAEISASAFRVAPVRPLLGRALTDADERPDAPSVVVIGHDVWMRRLGGAADVVGTVVRLGREQATVVGVMPEGFGFPIAHELWLPLRTDPGTVAPREGPEVAVFGRLADGASLADADGQLAVLGARAAAAHPETHDRTVPQVMPLTRSALGLPGSFSSLLVSSALLSSNIPVVLFLLLVCGNIALLMFARAATRESELIVRNALGASRGRIVGQLFAEALVLAGVASALGLAATGYGLRWAFRIVESELLEGPLPFWFHPSLSPSAIAYTVLLTALGAAVAGMLPALKVTRGLGAGLRQASAGGGGFRFGGVWTAVIVSQIALTVVFPVITFAVRGEAAREVFPDPEFPAHELLAARLELDEVAVEGEAVGLPAVAAELEERLLTDPAVVGVTFAERMPQQYHPWRQLEVEGRTAPPMDARGHRLGIAAVAPDFHSVLGVELRAGRFLSPADVGAEPAAVIVNETFVERVLGGGNAIGRRFRVVASEEDRAPDQEPGPWVEIVGVVENLGPMSGYGYGGVYRAADPAEFQPLRVAVRLRTDAAGFAPRLAGAAAAIDPSLRLHGVQTLDRVSASEKDFYSFWITLLMAVCAIGIALSLGTIYAVTSLTVSQRTREIGIRVALGSSRPRILGTVFRRPLIQIALGILAGGLALVTLLTGLAEEQLTLDEVGILAGYLAGMTAVCLLACVWPTRRALSIEPSEALRSE